MNETSLICLIVYCLAFGILSTLVSSNKNRNVVGWFFVGFIFGIFGFIASLIRAEVVKTEAKKRLWLSEKLYNEMSKTLAMKKETTKTAPVAPVTEKKSGKKN